MSVHSARLAEGTSAPASATHTIYTCPSGKTALLKDIRIDPGASTPTRAAVQASWSGGWVSIHDGPLPALGVRSIQGFIVLEPGDQIRLYSEGGTFQCILSGAELEGLAP